MGKIHVKVGGISLFYAAQIHSDYYVWRWVHEGIYNGSVANSVMV